MATLALQVCPGKEPTPGVVTVPPELLLVVSVYVIGAKLAWIDLLLLILMVVDALLTLATEPAPVPDQLRKE